MFDDISKIYFVAAVLGFVILYFLIRHMRPKTWVSISEPGKLLKSIGFIRDAKDNEALEMKLTNVELNKPAVRVLSEELHKSDVWIVNGDLDDDSNQSDYRLRGYVTSEGYIYQQSLKTEKPKLIGYTARKSDPNVPTVKGKRSWTSLWLDSELYAFSGNPEVQTEDPSNRIVGYSCLSGISFHNKGPVSLEAKACASAMLYGKFGPKEEKNVVYKDPAYSWNDTALLASIVFSFIFLALYFVYMFFLKKPLLGNDFTAAFILCGCYFLVWAAVREYKIYSIENSHSFQPQLDMLNKSLSLGKYDGAIVSLAGLAMYFSYMYYDHDFMPLIFAIMYGVSKNGLTRAHRQPWKIIANYDEEKTYEEEELMPGPFASMTPPSGEMVRVYDWDLDSANGVKVHGNLNVYFSMEEYSRMRQNNPYFSQKIEKTKFEYVTAMIDKLMSERSYSERIRYIASYINMESNHARLDEMDRLQFALDFVQEPNIDFVKDKDSKSIQFASEYVRFPDETLYDQEGDSDCKSFLAGSILFFMGYQVLFLSSSKKQHSAIAIELKDNSWLTSYMNSRIVLEDVSVEYKHRRYVYCETTGDGYRIGQLVDDMRIDDFETRVEFRNNFEMDLEDTIDE